MLKIAVCDDEQVAVRIIYSALKKAFHDQGVECKFELFTSSKELIDRLDEGEVYNVLFADISMPEMDGISLGTIFREQLDDTLLIFISTREDLVFDTFRARPFRFIRKKSFQSELPTLISDICMELRHRESRKIPFQCGTSVILLRPEKIIYVESFKKKQIIHSREGEFEIQSSFQKIMEQLKDYGFVQSHKSFFVNCRYICSINRTTLELDDHRQLPIGRSRVAEVKEAFRLYAVSGFSVDN